MAERKAGAGAASTEEEGYEIPVPPFDAEDYVRKEVINTRATIVLVLYGILLGGLSAALQIMLGNPLAALTPLLLGLVALKGVLETTGVDATEWDRKLWLGNGMIMLLTWLAAWVLFRNEPFVSAGAM